MIKHTLNKEIFPLTYPPLILQLEVQLSSPTGNSVIVFPFISGVKSDRSRALEHFDYV